MFHTLILFLEQADTIFWGYLGFSLIMALGIYFTLTTRFFQVRAFPHLLATFWNSLLHRDADAAGIHPIKALFASVGGMVGIGNLVGIITAVQIGGPGALFWAWIAAWAGALIKYSEVYLGLKHRVPNGRGGYDGGPMFFLRHAFGVTWVPKIVCILLCIYGVEIYQFSVVTDSVTANWSIDRNIVIVFLLGAILYAGIGGVSRVGKISSWLLPAFILAYLLMSFWVIFNNLAELPQIFVDVFKSAFTGQAAIGGFAGSTMILAIQHGISRAAYSADIGIGNDSVIHSESKTVHPSLQARLAVCGVFLDNFICTMSILVVLATGIWKASDPVAASRMVQTALSQYFPMMDIFMPVFLLILGYTTIIAYFCVGLKCAKFLFPKYGKAAYFVYATLALPLFSYMDQTHALLIMSLAGSLLLMINLMGIYRLRKQVPFTIDS